jgi:xylan 1,4-beta-xylosidase
MKKTVVAISRPALWILWLILAQQTTAVAPQRYCNPLPLPDYPVGRMAREIKLGDPVYDADYGWRLEKKEPYRELADPTALWHDNKWYLYPSADMAWVSEDEGLTWKHAPLNVRDIGYAPSVVHHDGRFLLLASESDLYTADSPLGPFTSLGPLQMPDQPNLPSQVDPMLFSDDDGRLYYYWGCTPRDGIWAVELDAKNPVKVIGKPQQVIPFEPDRFPWQRLGNANQDINRGWLEGAWMIKHQNRYYLTYSAGGTEYQTYAMACCTSDSPLGPFLPQQRNPILRNPNGFLTGTAHGSIVAGPRGQWWAFYTLFSGVAHNFERRVGFDLAAFDDQGELYIPAATATPQPLPNHTAKPVEQWLPLNQGERTTGSSTAPNLPGRFAADLSLLTWWQPAENDPHPILTTKLIAPSTLNACRIIWRDVGLDPLRGVKAAPFRYRVEAETRPGTWETIIDRSTNEQDLLIDYRECKPIQATRARLIILKSPDGISPAVTEFTLFGQVLPAP